MRDWRLGVQESRATCSVRIPGAYLGIMDKKMGAVILVRVQGFSLFWEVWLDFSVGFRVRDFKVRGAGLWLSDFVFGFQDLGLRLQGSGG